METVSLNDLVSNVLETTTLPSPDEYQYYKGLQNRRLIINDEISDSLLEGVILPLIDMDNDGTREPIEIIINTVGGDIYTGFNLVDVLEKIKTPTTIHIMGLAASMGILIAMAGKSNENVKTVCHPFSVGLLHSGTQYMEGTTHAVRDTFDFSEHYEEKIRNYVLSHTNITDEVYQKVERKEYWMDSDEMLRLGIVDEII